MPHDAKTTRRAILAGTLALPAAASAASAATTLDAELLAFDGELTKLEQERDRLNTTGTDISDEQGETFCAQCDALADYILACKAATAAGLAIQTRAVILVTLPLWFDVPDDYDRTERRFIEAVARFAGVTLPGAARE
jgi:hypothetical protein